jgi:hypothetical protein
MASGGVESGTYHLAPPEAIRLEQWADHLVARCEGFSWSHAEDATISFDGPPGRPRCPIDVARLRDAIPWWPSRTTLAAFDDYVDWLLALG